VGDDNLKSYITEFYKRLFGPHEHNNFSLDESLRDDIPQVSMAENEFLTASFSEKEIREAVFQMEHNKGPGPDGFPMEFYQHFWEVIKHDLLALLMTFIVEDRLSIVLILELLLCCQRKQMQRKYNSIASFVFLM